MGKKSLSFLAGILVLFLLVGCLNNGNDDPILYDVTFLGFNDVVLKQEEVEKGKSAVAPTAPEVSGYVFSNWDVDYKNINSDLTVKAIYTKESLKTFSVIFLNNSGVIIKIEDVTLNEAARAPKAPEVLGYTFVGWDTDFSVVTSDLTVKALYEESIYTVVFLDINEDVIKEEKLKYEEAATAPSAPEVLGYTFVGWDIDFSEVTSNLTVKAMYEEILEEYEVVFLNKDGEIIKTQIVIENESATAPNPPAVFGYTFVSWDLDFSNVVSNLEIRPIYEIRTYSVKFMSDNNLLKEEFVTYEGKATPPEVNKTGYKFIGWDQDVTRITRNLNINAVWQKIVHASYVSSFNFSEYKTYNDLLETLETSENLYYTFSDVKYGGTRGTNELVYYDETLTHNTNIYGLEVAIDSDGLVVEKATKVSIPTGGFVLSGHGSSNTLLDNTVQIGDYITYSDNNAYIYRNHQINNIISLAISLDKIKLDILKQDNLLYALDYQEIENIYNQVVSIYNLLLDEYVYAEFSLAEELLLTINFMLIEPKASTVRAVWHYPIRSSGYNEMNTYEVGKYLDKVKSIGINRIYLNTNFNGGSIYKSEYLTQRLTVNYTYDGYKDYLEAFIGEAHLRDIEVYAWTNTLIAGDGSNNSFYSSRGWILKGFNGEDNYNGMYYLDISNSEVQEFLGNIFNELASNYDLDGFEYDFIRFPVGRLHQYNTGDSTESLLDWGWTESFENKFKEKYSLTGDLKDLVTTNATIRNNWLTFKRETLDDTVEMISTTIRDANPNMKISAAVMTSLTGAKATYLQDWEKWIKQGLVDELNPMVYTADNSGLESQLKTMMLYVKDYADIVAGIYPQDGGGGNDMVAEQIRIVESLNILGVSKFSSRHIFGSHLEKAFEGLNRDYIVLPTTTKERLFNAYIENLKEKTLGYYIDRTNDPNFNHLIDSINSFTEEMTIEDKMIELLNIINLTENETIKERLITEHNRTVKYMIK